MVHRPAALPMVGGGGGRYFVFCGGGARLVEILLAQYEFVNITNFKPPFLLNTNLRASFKLYKYKLAL